MRMYTTRLACLAGIIAAIAAAPAASGIADGRSPDTRDAAYLAHLDGRSPDTIEAAAQAHATPAVPAITDGRSPDTRDAAFAAHTLAPVVTITDSGGFAWFDAGIGAAGGFAIGLVLASGVVVANRGGRRRIAA